MQTAIQNKLVPILRFGEYEMAYDKIMLGDFSNKISSGKSKCEEVGDYDVYGSTGKIGVSSVFSHNGNYLLVARVGANAGKINLVGGKFGVTDNTLVLDLNESININFTYYWLLGYNLNRLVFGSGQPLITGGQLKKVKLNIPTLPEQQKIAAFLSSVDEKLQQLNKKKSLLEDYKKGVMQKIFSQELRFKDANGNNYPDWEEKKLGEVMIERNIKTPKSKVYPLMSFVARKGVTPKGERYNREFLVNDSDNKKYKQTEFGDFIYSSNNLETGSIGLNNYGSATISPVYSIFKTNELFNYIFLSSYLTRKSFIQKMIRYRQGVVYGQWRIHESNFLKIEECFPSIEEQEKIANFLSAIDEKITLTNIQIDNTKAFKKGLLQQMFV